MTVPSGALIRNRRRREEGYGRVLEPREAGFALIAWPGHEPREMRLEGQDDLVRARLHPGQRVRVLEGQRAREGTVSSAADPDPDGLWRYAVELPDDEVRVVGEPALEPMGPLSAEPLETLRALAWRGARGFAARLELSRTLSLWYENSFGIPPFLGARIVPLPHQVHAARRVLTDRVPRFLLADEVGLGKTIEAGLVIQALAASNPGLRTLVVAPGAMSRQWLCELFLRFGEQVFVHLDAPRLDDPEWPELLSSPRVIVSTTALEASPDLQERLLAHGWDLVVIDEAHRVHPDVDLYGFARRLAEQSWGLLALSATPAKGDVRGLLGLLGLVAPDAYHPDRPERFARALEVRDAVASCLDEALRELDRCRAEGTSAPAEWRAARAAALTKLIPDDPHVAAVGARVTGDPDALGELLSYVQEYHRIDRRIVRTRRATVLALGTRLCERERVIIDYPAPPSEVALVEHVEALPAPDAPDRLQQVLAGLYRRRGCTDPLPMLALLERRRAALRARKRARARAASPEAFDPLAGLGADPGPAEEEYLLERVVRDAPPLPGEAAWLDRAVELTHAWMTDSIRGCARRRAALDWLRSARRGGGKVLVFAQDREVVEAFAEGLRDELGPDAVGALHHGLDEQQQSEVALRFQQPEGPCRVLVSDELGGEGRNFQAATAILHLDQPWAVGRLEQRIGRLDRIGRRAERPVRSVILRGPSPSERALIRLHDEALGVYERSLGGLEFLLADVQRQVIRGACADVRALEELVEPLRARVAAERSKADRSYERALDASARRLEEAADQADVLDSVDGAQDAASLSGWARRLGIKVKPLGDEQWRISWSWEHLRRPPPGVPAPALLQEGQVRRRGTFSRARALRDESLELFGPGHPLVDSLVRDLREADDGRAAAFTRNLGPERRGHCYLLVVARTSITHADLPAGLRYRAQAHLWPQVRTAAVRLLPGKAPGAVLATDRAVIAALEGTDSSDRTLDPDDLARSVDLPTLWRAAREAVDLALAAIRDDRRDEVEDAAARLTEELADDLAFLRGVASRGDPGEQEAARAELAAREQLLAAVRAEEASVEAVALIIGVGG